MVHLPEDKDYYTHFNLIRDPFPLDKVDKFLYLTPELNHRLDVLVNRIKSGARLQVVISPTGGGKTVMAEYLASFREPDWLTGLVRGDAKPGHESLVLELLKGIFPDREFDNQQAVSQLHQLLDSPALNGKIPVFIIDDAHELPLDSLQFILQLAGMRHNDSTYRIILFANESINDILDKPELQMNSDCVLTKLNLPPLSAEQTRSYIENRLSLSGESNRYPFSETELASIAKISAGLPGGINLLARQAMQQKSAYLPEKSTWTGRLRFAAVIPVIVMLAVLYYYFSGQLHNGSATDRIAVMAAGKAATVDKPASPATVVTAAAPAKDPAIEQQLLDAQPPPDLPEPATQAEIDTDTGNMPPVAASAAQMQDTPAASMPASEEGNREADESGREQRIEIAPQPDETNGRPIVGNVDYAPGNVFRLDSVPDIVKDINGPDWFRQQAPQLYVLQILSVSNFSNLERILNKIPEMQDQLSGYTNYTPSGKPRYLLYYGLYPDKDTAYAAVKDIPPPLQAVSPWPRGISSIIIQLDELEARGYH